jgi:hypothetical protein
MAEYSARALNGATQNGKITPASIAEAIGFGIEATNLPNAGHRPVRVSRSPVTRNAPAALAKPKPNVPDATKRAAPGVLQTIEIGCLKTHESTIERRP